MSTFKPWFKHTVIIAGVAGASTVVGTIAHELAVSAFAANPYGQVATIALAILGAAITKSPIFKGNK